MAESVEAPVIKTEDAAKSMSAIKKNRKKKISKNVLGLPDNAKVKPPIINEEEESNVSELLRKFLPAARLTIKPKKTKGSSDNSIDTVNYDAINKKPKKKRLELLIGVNALTRGIRQDEVAAALIAGDITPSQLAAHLNFKCSRKNIPYIYVSDLRQNIQDALGFPCIALGFKKDSESFLKIIKKISELYKELKQSETELVEEVKQESESEEEVPTVVQRTLEVKKETKSPFSYLYRSSCKERVFIPEEVDQEKPEDGFIALNTNVEEVKAMSKERRNALPGISHNIIEKFKKKKYFNFKSLEEEGIGMDETEEVPKKKIKKDWVIDKKKSKGNFNYAPANVIKYHSNIDRKEKVKKKKKKNFQPNKNKN